MTYNIIISSASPTLQFAGNSISFSASASPTNTFIYRWNFGDGNFKYTSVDNTTYQYNNFGTFKPSVSASANDGNGSSIIGDVIIRINSHFDIAFTGKPKDNETLTFYISVPNHHTGTITALNWDFGDGTTATMATPYNTVTHAYTAVGNYPVSLSAFDTSGNVGISTTNIAILENNLYEEKDDYITLCGPGIVRRFGESRYINLVDYLPDYLRDSPTETFLKLFEDYLNTMFSGTDGYTLSSVSIPVTKGFNTNPVDIGYRKMINTYDITTPGGTVSVISDSSLSADKIYNIEPDSLSSTDPRISILEKVQRLTELHDPGLIDLDYIQFFANNLGYSINVNRNEVGLEWGTTLIESVPGCSGTEQENYLRFVVESLPSWYKIKTTNNAIKIMLYSFGLIADLATYYTNNYLPTVQGGSWVEDFPTNSVLTALDKSYYPTPHFAIFVDLEKSLESSISLTNLIPAIKAIDTVRPINTVFRRLAGYRTDLIDLYVGMITLGDVLHKIDNGDANTFSDQHLH